MTVYIQQIPRWHVGLVRIVCDHCGYESDPYDTNTYRQRMKAQTEHRTHLCLPDEEDE